VLFSHLSYANTENRLHPKTSTRNCRPMNSEVRLVAYNLRQGGTRDPAVWARMLPNLAPDLLFVQESRDPTQAWLAALPVAYPDCGLWEAVQGGRQRWGSGLWVRDGRLTKLPVPEEFAGRVVAAVVEGRQWPVIGAGPVVAMSIHAPTRQGSSYMKEVG